MKHLYCSAIENRKFFPLDQSFNDKLLESLGSPGSTGDINTFWSEEGDPAVVFFFYLNMTIIGKNHYLEAWFPPAIGR